MQQFIRSNTNYPENLKNQKINGEATVSFTIDTDGSIINPTVTRNAEVFIMDKEALRTIMIMPDWIPAEQDGVPIGLRSAAPEEMCYRVGEEKRDGKNDQKDDQDRNDQHRKSKQYQEKKCNKYIKNTFKET